MSHFSCCSASNKIGAVCTLYLICNAHYPVIFLVNSCLQRVLLLHNLLYQEMLIPVFLCLLCAPVNPDDALCYFLPGFHAEELHGVAQNNGFTVINIHDPVGIFKKSRDVRSQKKLVFTNTCNQRRALSHSNNNI